MAEQRKRLSVGLLKKNESNKMEDYMEMAVDGGCLVLGNLGKNF